MKGFLQILIFFQEDDLEQQEPKLSSEEFPQSPIQFLNDMFLDITENEALVSMFDRLQEATSIHIELHSREQRDPTCEYITQQMFSNTHDHQNEQLKKLELERTLMDIALYTILEDDSLQCQEISKTKTRIEPISLPLNRRCVQYHVKFWLLVKS